MARISNPKLSLYNIAELMKSTGRPYAQMADILFALGRAAMVASILREGAITKRMKGEDEGDAGSVLEAIADESRQMSFDEWESLAATWRECDRMARSKSEERGIGFVIFDEGLRDAKSAFDALANAAYRGLGYDAASRRGRDAAERLRELQIQFEGAPNTPPSLSLSPAPPAGEAAEEKGEGGTPPEDRFAGLPPLLSATDLAKRIGGNRKSVTSFLTRFAEKNPDCRIENEGRRRNEPTYLYRTDDVWGALKAWMADDAELKRD